MVQTTQSVEIIRNYRGGSAGYVPFWDIIRDGQFIIGAQTPEDAERNLVALEANNWKFLACYCRLSAADPLDWIAKVREKEWRFLDASIEIGKDGRAFFHGNIVQYSAAFRFLILDDGLLKEVIKAVPEVPVCR